MSTRVVVPCFDEAERLDGHAFARLAQHVTEVIFVDDGSTDATPQVLADLARHHPGIDVLTLPRNVGKAEAVRLGMLAAIDRGSSVVAYLDADLATPVPELVRLIELLEAQPDRTAVLGSRVALLGHTVRRRPVRHYLGRFYATAASLALGVAVYDTQCGAKVFRVGDPLRTALADRFRDRWSFDVELLARLLAAADGADEPILEVPLREWHDIPGSSVGLRQGARALVALAGVRRRARRRSRVEEPTPFRSRAGDAARRPPPTS